MADARDFFVSYNKADLRWAEWIAFQLEENGYTVEIQAWDSRPGANFVAWMHEASVNCERTLAVLSPDYFAGRFSEMEWTAALYAGKLLPVRVAEFEVPGLFGPIGYLDLAGINVEREALEQLLAGIKAEPAKPKTAPFPAASLTPMRNPAASRAACRRSGTSPSAATRTSQAG